AVGRGSLWPSCHQCVSLTSRRAERSSVVASIRRMSLAVYERLHGTEVRRYALRLSPRENVERHVLADVSLTERHHRGTQLEPLKQLGRRCAAGDRHLRCNDTGQRALAFELLDYSLC